MINLVNKGVQHFLIGDDRHMTSMKIAQFSRPPTHFVHLYPKFFHPLDLGRPISNEPPPPPTPNDSVHVNERNQNNCKTKSRHIEIDRAFYSSIWPYKQCNGIIKK